MTARVLREVGRGVFALVYWVFWLRLQVVIGLTSGGIVLSLAQLFQSDASAAQGDSQVASVLAVVIAACVCFSLGWLGAWVGRRLHVVSDAWWWIPLGLLSVLWVLAPGSRVAGHGFLSQLRAWGLAAQTILPAVLGVIVAMWRHARVVSASTDVGASDRLHEAA